MAKMSSEAHAAIMSVTGQRQGARPTSMDDFQARELKDLGYIGKDGGLTRKGSIYVQQQREADLDRLFGPQPAYSRKRPES